MAPRTKKLINQPDRILPEMLEGLALAYPQYVRVSDDGLVTRARPAPGTVPGGEFDWGGTPVKR